MSAELERCRAEYGDPRLDCVDDEPPQAPRRCRRYVVAVYLVDRTYGGPEEGGWWFDTGELVRLCRVFGSGGAASSWCRRLNRALDRTLNRGRRPLYSVLSQGIFRAEVHEHTAPTSYPARRPHYE